MFKNKVVLVTGASSGIGAATAILFTKEGAEVAIVARNEAKMNKVQQECAKFGHQPLLIKADVSNDDDVQRIVKTTIEKFKKLDVLINNAGIFKFGTILDQSLTDLYDEVMNTNVRAVVILTSLCAPYLIQTKGNIVNVSSIAGLSAISDAIMYCTSKAALNQFSRGSALELSTYGVRVNIVSPGPVDTDILENVRIDKCVKELGITTALGNRVSAPEEVAELILFLASEKARGITGSNYVTDNGQLLLK